MSKWKPIETAPKDGTEVLLTNTRMAHPIVYVGRYAFGASDQPRPDDKVWRATCCGRYAGPTHWMPLPEPPEEER